MRSERSAAAISSYLLLLLLCSINLGCNRKAYRLGANYGNAEGPPVIGPNVANCIADAQGRCPDPNYSLSFIEFDDVGEMWSIGDLKHTIQSGATEPRSQLQMTLDLIETTKLRAAKTNRPLLVLSFIHGWHHNAKSNDPNLASFKRSLQYLSEHYTGDCETPGDHRNSSCPLVVGVYLSWRGESENLPLVKYLTYFSRRAAANRAGGSSMTEAVTRLALATKGAPQPLDENHRCKDSHTTALLVERIPGSPSQFFAPPKATFLIVGHSFGGRVLEHAVAQPVLAYLLQRQTQANECGRRWNEKKEHASDQISQVDLYTPLDLAVFVNPANDAFDAKSLIEGFKRTGISGGPVLMSIKSDGDSGTGGVMFVAQSITEPELQRHSYDKPTHDKPNEPSACKEGQLGDKTQGFYYKRSPAGIPNMRSQVVNEKTLDGFDPNNHTYSPDQLKKFEIQCNHLDPGNIFWSENPGRQGCYQITTVESMLQQDLNHDMAGDISRYYSCDRTKTLDPATGLPLWPKGTPAHAWNDTPYYVISTPKSLIWDHNDIFQQGLLTLILNAGQGSQQNPEGTTVTVPISAVR